MQRSYVNTFPTSDPAFRRAALRLAGDGRLESADALAAQLRPLFPKVAVFERQLSGEARRFYAYRDGRYWSSRSRTWWERPHTPSVSVSTETGRLTAVNPESAAVMGVEPSRLVGRHFREFVQAAAQPAAEAMFEALAEEPEVQTQALVVRPDGSSLLIELRAVRGDGQIEITYRPVEGTETDPAT